MVIRVLTPSSYFFLAFLFFLPPPHCSWHQRTSVCCAIPPLNSMLSLSTRQCQKFFIWDRFLSCMGILCAFCICVRVCLRVTLTWKTSGASNQGTEFGFAFPRKLGCFSPSCSGAEKSQAIRHRNTWALFLCYSVQLHVREMPSHNNKTRFIAYQGAGGRLKA